MSVFCFFLIFLSVEAGKAAVDDQCCNYKLVEQCKTDSNQRKGDKACNNAIPYFPIKSTKEDCEKAIHIHATAKFCVRGNDKGMLWVSKIIMKEQSALHWESVRESDIFEFMLLLGKPRRPPYRFSGALSLGIGATFRMTSINRFEMTAYEKDIVVKIEDYASLHVRTRDKENKERGSLSILGNVHLAKKSVVELEPAANAHAYIKRIKAGAYSFISIHGVMWWYSIGVDTHKPGSWGSYNGIDVSVGPRGRLEMYGEPIACYMEEVQVGEMAMLLVENWKTAVKLYLPRVTISDMAALKVTVTGASATTNVHINPQADVGPLTIVKRTQCVIMVGPDYAPIKNKILKAGDAGPGYHCEEYTPLQQLKADLENKTQEIKELVKKLNGKKKEIEGLVKEIKEKKKKINELDKNFNEKKNDIKELKEKLNVKTKNISDLIEKFNEKTTDNNNLLEKLNKGEKRIKELMEKFNATSEEKGELEDAMNSVRKQAESQGKQLDEVQQSLNATKETLNETEKHLRETEIGLNETEKILKETETSLNEAEKSLAETGINLRDTQQSLKEAVESLKETETRLNKTAEALADKESDAEGKSLVKTSLLATTLTVCMIAVLLLAGGTVSFAYYYAKTNCELVKLKKAKQS